MKVNLFYLSPNPYGGWVTYTVHLMQALRSVGLMPCLYKVRQRTENFTRKFGYDEVYQNVSLTKALDDTKSHPSIVVAAAKKFKPETEALLGQGAFLVLHDPTELKNLPLLDPNMTIVDRRTGLASCPGATFIRHPYGRAQGQTGSKTMRAVSTSRIDFDKHTELLLDANRLLPESMRINIRGFENRIYTRFKIVPKYPEWEQSKAAYPRERDAAFALLSSAELSVDMSLIKGDGGGTQYTTLEAWDAGAVPVIHRGWIRPGDDMVENENCMVVEDAQGLADIVRCSDVELEEEIRLNGQMALARHDPKKIGAQYKELLL